MRFSAPLAFARMSLRQVMDDADFQLETFKLREREYKYYVEANLGRLPRIPDLADNTGGLSNSTYFNFIQYCLWKVVYRHITAQQDREAFARAAAVELLTNLSTMSEQSGQTGGFEAAARTPEAVTCAAVLPFLEVLRTGGYICRYQLVLGSHPGTWPRDWMISQPAVVYADAGVAGEAGLPTSGGEFLFQLKLHRPADILSSVALRSEEDGSWPHTVSSCLLLLLERGGLCPVTVEPATGAPEGQQQQRGSSCANAETGCLFGGCGVVECDEFFYQDQWEGPKSFADKMLLFFGDPLQQVAVDFVPTTLVQNWRLRQPAALATDTAR
ncbi:hypothetical protein Vretifemale_3159 [Volvox reticuliferus]|uniref:Uncharacterized protein n=1 Tax=Volvox reticuliferus TaxID=1737510 RepID=A0A8J4FEG2_9CHLO|nr:hypothetical protein Vretifemale_3159 [Volvox reticuliferus]